MGANWAVAVLFLWLHLWSGLDCISNKIYQSTKGFINAAQGNQGLLTGIGPNRTNWQQRGEIFCNVTFLVFFFIRCGRKLMGSSFFEYVKKNAQLKPGFLDVNFFQIWFKIKLANDFSELFVKKIILYVMNNNEYVNWKIIFWAISPFLRVQIISKSSRQHPEKTLWLEKLHNITQLYETPTLNCYFLKMSYNPK